MSGLRQEDFTVFEDGAPQSITHFSSERVPVVSVSRSTRAAAWLRETDDGATGARSISFELLDATDEIFLTRSTPTLT